MRLTANEVRSQILRRFKSSRLRREIIPALLGRDYLFVRNQAGEDLGRACASKRWFLSSPPKNGSTHMGGAFFVAKSCEDLGGADCVIVGDHLQSEWQSDGSSRLINRMPYPRMQATIPLVLNPYIPRRKWNAIVELNRQASSSSPNSGKCIRIFFGN